MFLSVLLSSCQDRKPAIDTFGQLDTAMVAADTTMQVNMDRSYEYMRTFAEGDTVAYDFLAYDKPKGSSSPEWESKFILIRRSRTTSDTVVKSIRSNVVKSSWMSDLDANGRRELFFYEFPKAAGNGWAELYAYESNGRRPMSKIDAALRNDRAHYRGGDSFFVAADRLVRIAPYYRSVGDSIPSGQERQSYRLAHGKLVFETDVVQ